MIEIYAVNIKEKINKLDYLNLLSNISEEKKIRINKFYRIEDAQRALIADILIRVLTCKKLSLKNGDITFCFNEFGKPYINNISNYHFNISHSGKWVVCCIDDQPVGIDVEQMNPIDLSIAERFFSKEEFNRLKSKNSFEQKMYFYDLWTLKESYIKAEGKGLSILLNSFTMKINKTHIAAYKSSELISYHFNQYNIDENYRLAVCAKRDKFPHNISLISINELIKEIYLVS